MELILQNLPESNEEIYLLLQSSFLNSHNQIIYNKDDKNDTNHNEIIISQNKYKFEHIYQDPNKEFFSNIITKNISIKNDVTLLLMLNKDNNDIIISLKNFFNKEFFDKNNIKLIKYNFDEINLDNNICENILKDKIINKESEDFLIDISVLDDKNKNIILFKIKIDYEDINICSFIKIFLIYNSYDKIMPMFSKNKIEKQISILNEKINNLMLLEKNIKEKMENIPFINNDFIQNINIYREEVITYFDKFIQKIAIENKENISKNKNNKNNLNELIKDAKKLIDTITNEQFKNKENNIYQQYIKIYSDINKTFEKINNNDIQELKLSINKFNDLNEELLNFLEQEKQKNNKEINNEEKDKELKELKDKITQLENELKKEKNKSTLINEHRASKEPKIKPRSISTVKSSNRYDNNNNLQQKLEEENKKLKKIIEEQKETISILKSKNESLLKSQNKNPSLSHQTGKNITSLNLLNSPKKTTNQNQTEICSTSKKNKTLNKTKTNTDILISGHSLLLLRKIQQENKELSKQLKDFSDKNSKLELSLKGMTIGDINIKNNSSLLNSFTKNIKGELKNIEKKYGLSKNK